MNRTIVLGLLAICSSGGADACVRASSAPLASPHIQSNYPTPSEAESGNSSQASGYDSKGAVGALSSPRFLAASDSGGSNTVAAASADDPRIGVHKSSDDTRINSGAGDATPVRATGSSRYTVSK